VKQITDACNVFHCISSTINGSQCPLSETSNLAHASHLALNADT
jgi:hypothetical protein